MIYLRRISSLLFLIFLITQHTIAQNNIKTENTGSLVIPNIDTWKIQSSAIGEEFTLYVLRTKQYDTSNKKHPVLYMTDGDWNMTVVMNCFNMLRQDYITHEPLVVGIGYGKGENKRSRDLNPEKGGPLFLKFIETEVMPFINQQYRTSSEKSIYGFSLGGMFATYILFNRPELFNMVFIGAPGYNGRHLMPDARKYFSSRKELKNKVFVGVGSFEKEVVKNIDSFKTFLLSKKLPELEIHTQITPKAGHGAALAQVMQNAMAFGYCVKRKAISIDPKLFDQFKGLYSHKDKLQPDATVFIQNKKLWIQWKVPNDIPIELQAQSKNEFFMEENERPTFRFEKSDGNQKMIIVGPDGSEHVFLKK